MEQQRLFYLDNLRGFAILFGIFVHTCLLADFGALNVIPKISDNFRMGTFFAVSGFFGGLLLTKHEAFKFLARRFQALGLPLLAGLMLLNPVTLWLMFQVKNGPAPISQIPDILAASFRTGYATDEGPQGWIVWHLHLWFLVALLVYTVAAPWVLRLIDANRARPGLRQAMGHIPGVLQPLAIALVVAVAVLGMRVVFSFGLKPLDAPWMVQMTLIYWPYHIMGLVLFREEDLWARVHRIDVPLIIAAGLFWFLSILIDSEGILYKTVYNFRRELTICASFFALLWIFRTVFNSGHVLARMLGGAVYTIYLFHFMVVHALGLVLIPIMAPGSVALFVLVSGATFAVTFSLHVLVAERSKLFRLLFNGKRGLAAPA